MISYHKKKCSMHIILFGKLCHQPQKYSWNVCHQSTAHISLYNPCAGQHQPKQYRPPAERMFSGPIWKHHFIADINWKHNLIIIFWKYCCKINSQVKNRLCSRCQRLNWFWYFETGVPLTNCACFQVSYVWGVVAFDTGSGFWLHVETDNDSVLPRS